MRDLAISSEVWLIDFCNARQTMILTLVQMHVDFLPRLNTTLLSNSSTSCKQLDLREKEKSEGNTWEAKFCTSHKSSYADWGTLHGNVPASTFNPEKCRATCTNKPMNLSSANRKCLRSTLREVFGDYDCDLDLQNGQYCK